MLQNIFETEDLVKSLPDERLFKIANPHPVPGQQADPLAGQIPQFLAVSEVQRRTDMRKRYQNQQQEMPQGTVTDQILQEGIASVAPPPQQMAEGGRVHPWRERSSDWGRAVSWNELGGLPGFMRGLGYGITGRSIDDAVIAQRKADTDTVTRADMVKAAIARREPLEYVLRLAGDDRDLQDMAYMAEYERTKPEPPPQQPDPLPTGPGIADDENLWQQLSRKSRDELAILEEGMAHGGIVSLQSGGNIPRMGLYGKEWLPDWYRDKNRIVRDGMIYEVGPGNLLTPVGPEVDLPRISRATLDEDPSTYGYTMEDLRPGTVGSLGAATMGGANVAGPIPQDIGLSPEAQAGMTRKSSTHIGPGQGLASMGEFGLRVSDEMREKYPWWRKAGDVVSEAVGPLIDFGQSGIAREFYEDTSRALFPEEVYDPVFKAATATAEGLGNWYKKLAGKGWLWGKDEPTTEENYAAVPDVVEERGVASVAALPSAEGQKDPQQQARSKIQNQGTGAGTDADMIAGLQGDYPITGEGGIASMLFKLMDEERPEYPDFSKVVESQKRDSLANAMMQIGAGIASNRTGAGLSAAGAALMRGKEKAREMEMAGMTGRYASEMADRQFDMNVLGTVGRLSVDQMAKLVDARIQAGRNENMTMRFVIEYLQQKYPPNVMMNPEDRARAMNRDILMILGNQPGLLEKYGFDQLLQQPGMTTTTTTTRPSLDSFKG